MALLNVALSQITKVCGRQYFWLFDLIFFFFFSGCTPNSLDMSLYRTSAKEIIKFCINPRVGDVHFVCPFNCGFSVTATCGGSYLHNKNNVSQWGVLTANNLSLYYPIYCEYHCFSWFLCITGLNWPPN